MTITASRGRPPATGASSPFARTAPESALARAADPDYFDWLSHVWGAAGCSRPVRLQGTLTHVDTTTGEVVRVDHTDAMPDGVIYKPCGNRRMHECPACAEVYRRDAFHLLRSGLVGGKGISENVSAHPAVFATFTAPSFGSVHARVIRHHVCRDRSRCTCHASPCHARRDAGVCPHGVPLACYTRHAPGDPDIGRPLCPDCYDYAAAVVWNNASGELWRRTKQAAERYLCQLARSRGLLPVRLAHGKVAEYQARGAVHFHALFRLDGVDVLDLDAVVPPPDDLTAADLTDALHHAAAASFTTGPHPANPGGWRIGWGTQLDIRTIAMTGDGTVTDMMVAGYLAKYATKGTEVTGHASRRLDPDTIEMYANPGGGHTERLIAACWQLGTAPGLVYGSKSKNHGWNSLQRWAHMLGFGGHFLTKARRYSVTFSALREARTLFRQHQVREHDEPPVQGQDLLDAETVIVITGLSYDGSGWKTTGDALLANTAADLARSRREVAREETAG